ncbi:dipeptidyl aminopeptidase/acylaminoacyl peptidase [Streptomyces sp. SAI-133]|uniref:S9 family peptidase n=1 Tax=Streptomyces sp. SAI-133 TaxID=2940547 RepID=UPI002475599F|nr:S9 family peptidase [Streptomyces sp. SAI-133]MDH6581051.1 dipeptidyl aminopeptidase/acylaminoacyl peptidase [Streptomyces sp. SAI-133]
METGSAKTTSRSAVEEHLRRLHQPAFGTPHALREAHITADGRHVTVTGVVLDALEGLPRTAVYTAEEGRLVPVSAAHGSAHGASHSPDGSTLAFLSDRGTPHRFQLHLLAADRLGEAVAAPAVPGSVEYAHWSPDGRAILLGVAPLDADLAGSQGSATVGTASPEPDRSWQPLVETGVGGGLRSLWQYSLDTGEVRQISPDGVNCWEANWCGPGHVLAVASEGPDEDSWYGATLRLIDLADGSCRELYHSDVQLGVPAGSPDGATAAVVRAVCSDRWIVAGDLVLIDIATGRSRTAEAGGTDVTALQWIDADRLGFFGLRHLDSVAGIIDPRDGSMTEVLSTSLACGGATPLPAGRFTTDGSLLTVRESYDLPQQLVLADARSERVLASTAHPGTDYLRSVAGTARPLSWVAPDGLEIEGVLCTPGGPGPFPLVVSIHGGPVWGYRNTWSMNYPWVPLLVSRGYAVLSPNPRGSSGRGQEFARQVVGDMGGADAHDILAGIDHLVDEGTVQPERIGLIGGSYGGFMSSWLVTQDTRFAASVPVSPVTNWYSQSLTSNIGEWGNSFLKADLAEPGSSAHTRSPVFHAHEARTPCLVVAGAKDRCTPPGQAREFHQALRAQGIESTLLIYPQEGHGVRSHPAVADFLTRALDWFERHMPARP